MTPDSCGLAKKNAENVISSRNKTVSGNPTSYETHKSYNGNDVTEQLITGNY